ncbi:LbetaH domain-containing protein [Aurantiacibacter marinus]
MLEDSCLGPNTDCYNAAKVTLGKRAIVSQKAYLCTPSHTIDDSFTLVGAPIHIDDFAWVAARAMVGPGVTINRGAVVGAGAVVTKDVAPGKIVAGNPAREVSESALGQSDGAITRQADR